MSSAKSSRMLEISLTTGDLGRPMDNYQVFEQSIAISAPITWVDRTLTDRDLMHRWLNPKLRCDPVGEWKTDVGAQSRFIIQVPFSPTLHSTVVERRLGLVVWAFDGFFQGRDSWQCCLEGGQTHLYNRFEFKIPNPLVNFGFQTFAAAWTRQDMQDQLVRLKAVAESLGAETPQNSERMRKE